MGWQDYAFCVKEDGSGYEISPPLSIPTAEAKCSAGSRLVTVIGRGEETAATQVPGEIAVVASITDGDTIRLADGRALRYIGVDTPETVAPGQPVDCHGPESSQRNAELVLGHTVRLERDVNETDRYGRILRYVYLQDGRMVNEVLVAEGFAEAIVYPPDTRYQGRLDAAEDAARAAGRGRWAACVTPTAPPVVQATVSPGQPQGQCPEGCTAPPANCAVKGNVSSSSGENLSCSRTGGL